MMNKRFFFLIAYIIFAMALPQVSFSKEPPEVSKLTLSAQALVRKPADELQFKIGVVTLSDQADTALVENSIRMQSVVKSLENAGIERTEYETGHFDIHPTYTPYPKDPPQDWKPTINGYEVTNFIHIHTDKLDSAGQLIDAANRAGANRIENIRFTLHNPHSFRDEAIRTATANAIKDAKAIAEAAGVQLVRLLSVALDSASLFSSQDNTMYLAKGFSAESTPIEPGEVTLTATVTVVYEISP